MFCMPDLDGTSYSISFEQLFLVQNGIFYSTNMGITVVNLFSFSFKGFFFNTETEVR